MTIQRIVVLLVMFAGLPSVTPAQESAAMLAEGWSRLAKGDAAGAANAAAQVLAKEPLSVAGAALAVDAELARSGAAAALNAYDRWLGNRRVDDGYVLRRIARRILHDASGQQPNVTARLEALRALAADGDADALTALENASSSGRYGETRALAALGNDRAVDRLISQLTVLPEKSPVIDALASSGSPKAIRPLMAVLTDRSDVNRAAAADALGKLEARDAIPQLKAMLQDPVFAVRLKAAGALYRLNDSSGLPLLSELAQSEHAGIRIAVAREMAVQPDASWQNTVRVLAGDPDPAVRLQAAKLIAPYDLSLAQRVLDDLMRDANIAIREQASGVVVDQVATDFFTLRSLLRNADISVRVKASARILDLTR